MTHSKKSGLMSLLQRITKQNWNILPEKNTQLNDYFDLHQK